MTTPIIGAEEYDKAIMKYFASLEEGYDSLVGVKELRNFLLNHEGRIINNTTDIPWPRTQDLETLYEINHTMFIASRGVYQEKKNRLGDRPYLYVMDGMLSFDIDWEEDFKMAEMIYTYLKNNGLMK